MKNSSANSGAGVVRSNSKTINREIDEAMYQGILNISTEMSLLSHWAQLIYDYENQNQVIFLHINKLKLGLLKIQDQNKQRLQ